MAARYLPVSWKTYAILCRKLAATVQSASSSVDMIVAISRGGLTLGHLLSDHLRIPIATITIQSYTDIQTQGKVVVTAKLQMPIREKRILLVDDVADSGKTLTRAVRYLKRAGAGAITTATLFFKPRSILRPDFFCRQTTRWILFPYEPTEMILLITKQLEAEGKSKKDIQAFLHRLGYTDEDIAFVRKYHLS